MKLYSGPLDRNKMMPLEKRAYAIFYGQKARCYSRNNPSYRDYGAKGIRVENTVREFIPWWIGEFQKQPWVIPSVGRIDHSKNYSFDNVRMEEKAANIRERNERLGNPTRRKAVVAEIVFNTMEEAETILGGSP